MMAMENVLTLRRIHLLVVANLELNLDEINLDTIIRRERVGGGLEIDMIGTLI